MGYARRERGCPPFASPRACSTRFARFPTPLSRHCHAGQCLLQQTTVSTGFLANCKTQSRIGLITFFAQIIKGDNMTCFPPPLNLRSPRCRLPEYRLKLKRRTQEENGVKNSKKKKNIALAVLSCRSSVLPAPFPQFYIFKLFLLVAAAVKKTGIVNYCYLSRKTNT